MAITEFFPGIKIVDSDTHWTEPHDLWTSLAPDKYKDLVPQIREHNGRRKWVVNGDIPIAGDSAVSAILPDGEKMLGLKFLKHDIEMVHAASYDCDARLELMDAMGVSHGIVYPNVGGFGNQNFLKVEDRALRIVEDGEAAEGHEFDRWSRWFGRVFGDRAGDEALHLVQPRLLAEEGEVIASVELDQGRVTCEFCNREYLFDPAEFGG